MATPQARPGDILDARPLGASFSSAKTTVLVKSDALQVIRLVVPRGKAIPTHATRGDITVHCLEGRVAFTTGDRSFELQAGDLLHLPGGQPHSLEGLDDASLLVTIALTMPATPEKQPA